MFNPVIVIAIIIQAIITRISLIVGAVVGYLISTGILIWGLSVYGDSDQIAFFSIPLSKPVFIGLCLVWYAFDTWTLVSAMKTTKAIKMMKEEIKKFLDSPLMKEERVVRFYETTRDAWASGKLSKINSSYKKEGKKAKKSLEYLMTSYPPLNGNALGVFFEKFKPLPEEYMISQGAMVTKEGIELPGESAWFLLTNRRLIQRTGWVFEFKEIKLARI